jgi:diguanylate cyclase (GGDEF)-like protein/PAS domain S-box-containing protein
MLNTICMGYMMTQQSESASSNQHVLHPWREEVLTLTLRIMLILALPAMILDLINAVALHMPWRIVFDLGIAVILCLVTFVTRMGFLLRLAVLLVATYMFATVWLVMGGLVGTGRLYFFLLIVFAALLLGRRSTLLIWLGALLTIALIYTGFVFELIPLPMAILEYMFMPTVLAINWLVQVMVSGVVGTAIILTVSRLQRSLQEAEQARAKLQHLNNELEQRVQERTNELRENQALLHAILDHAPAAVFARNANGETLIINRTTAALVGMEPEQAADKHIKDFFPADVVHRRLAQDQQVIASEQPLEIEEIVSTPAGLRTMLTVKFPICDAAGHVFAVGGIATDITERKQAEAALRESETRLRAIWESATNAMVISDRDGVVLMANPAYTTLYGYPLEQVIGQPFTLIFPEDRRAYALEIYQDIFSSDVGTQPFESTIRRADGSERIVESHVSFLERDGQRYALLSIVHDITERKHTEDALRESQRFIQKIADTIPGILYVYDLIQNRNVYSNDQMLDILGYSAEDAQAMGSEFIPSLLHPDDLPRIVWHRADHEDITDEMIVTFEYRIRGADGTWHWLLSHEVAFMRTDDGKPQQILGIAHDITERKQMEQAIQRRMQQLEALREIMHQITSELELEPLLQAVLERAVSLLDATSGQIALYDSESDELEILACTCSGHEGIRTRRAIANDATSLVIRTQQPLVIPDYQQQKDYLPQYAHLGGHALLLVPLPAKDQARGVLITGHDHPERSFSDDDVELLTLFAQQVTVALQNARLFTEVQRLATLDPLTELYNRRSFAELAQQTFEQARRYGYALSVIMLDIDHFKQVNDQFGHLAGDQMLQAVARQCLMALRTADVIGRYGGEEIVMVLPETNGEQARQVAERLRHSLSMAPIPTDRGVATLTVSLGVASVSHIDGISLEQLIDLADQALYAAKQAGRNRVIVWEPHWSH